MVRSAGRKRKPAPVNLPGYDGRMELAPDIVDDPMPVKEGEKRAVMRNMAVSPLLAIFYRKRLHAPWESPDEAVVRFEAGQKFRALYERAEMGGSRAIDYSALKVDVSFVYRDVPESAVEALRALARAARALKHHYPTIHAIVGEEVKFAIWADQVAGREAGRADRLDAYQRLRDALDALVNHFGIGKGRNRVEIRSEMLDSAQVDRDN